MTLEEVLKNKDILIAEKKATIKRSDALCYVDYPRTFKTETVKDAIGQSMEIGKLDLSIIGNTTNFIDSHCDVHIPGLWKKTLSDQKQMFLLQEHEWEFEAVIADSIKNPMNVFTQSINWNKLGVNYTGKTEALTMDVTIDERNEFMFNQYRKGYVNNHSVGMQYVKIFMCANSENPNYPQEKANWDKYYPMVVNKERADELGYFWAVTEAKLIEVSAVVRGSNPITPTMSTSENTTREYCDECQQDTEDLSTDNGTKVCKGCGTRRKSMPSNDTQKNEPLKEPKTTSNSLYF